MTSSYRYNVKLTIMLFFNRKGFINCYKIKKKKLLNLLHQHFLVTRIFCLFSQALQGVIDDLKPGTQYNVNVRAFNDVGEGPVSKGIVFETQPGM